MAEEWEFYETSDVQVGATDHMLAIEPPREAGTGWQYERRYTVGRLVIFVWKRPAKRAAS